MIGDRIGEAREKKGFTQSALAKALGVSRSAVNAWEMGVNVPSAQYLVEMSKLFNVSADFLLDLNRKETIDITPLEDDEKQILYTLMKYFEKYRRSIKVLDDNGYTELKEEYAMMKKSGVPLPAYFQKVFDEMFG